MPILFRDYETRSVRNLTRVGSWKYTLDPITDVWCCAYAVDDGPVALWVPGDPIPAEFVNAANNSDWVTSAFNDTFERHVELHIMAPRYGWPVIPLQQRRCTQAAALALALPASLKAVAKTFEIPQQKDEAGRRLMLQMMRPRKPRQGEDPAGIYWFDDPERRQRLYAYCKRDVEVERAVHRLIGHLPDAEQLVWQLDATINDRGLMIDAPITAGAIKIGSAAQEAIDDELTTVTGGSVTSVGQTAKLLAWLAANGINLENVQKETVRRALTRKELPPAVRRALELRHQGAHIAAAKFETMRSWAAADGRIHGAFKYHGAATGRWTSFGVQFQNLKKQNGLDTEAAIALVSQGSLAAMRKHYADPLAVVGEVARAAVIAAPGHRLITADFSGIESRVLAWLAGEQWKIDQWAKFDQSNNPKDEPYFVTGKGFGFDDDKARTPGKTGDLAFGYVGGLGAWRKFAGDEMPDQEVERLKRAWRDAHPNIVKLWGRLDRCALRAVANPKQVQRVNQHLAFCFDGTFLRLKLPSGRCLAYPFARLEDNARGNRVVVFKDNAGGKFVDCRHGHGAWPGLWTENAVQAVARDLLREGMMRLEAAGDPIALHVHDEVVAEVPDGFGSEEDFLRILTEVPLWATGLPVAAKARSGRRFCKINKPDAAPETATADVPFDDPIDIADDIENDPDDSAEQADSNHGAEDREANNHGREWAGYQSGEREWGSDVAEYVYYDAGGQPYLKIRRTTKKQFPQYHHINGKWSGGAPKGPKIPYRLPELLRATPDAEIFVCEGEKDADNVAALGLIATTNSGGAGKWTAELTPYFMGRQHLYVLEDNDDAGRNHARLVARALRSVVEDVRIVSFPDLDAKGDVSDWLEQGHTKAELLARCKAAPEFADGPRFEQPFDVLGLMGQQFAEVSTVIDTLLPEGLALFAGKPKIGKSWLLYQIAWSVAEGGKTLGGYQCLSGDVLYCALEDNKRRMKKRLAKQRPGETPPAGLFLTAEMPRLAEGGLDYIRNWLKTVKRPRLVIIDTLAVVRTPAKRNQTAYEADYEALLELRNLAAEYRIAIVVTHHLRKAEAEDVFDTISGTLGLTGCVDTILIIKYEANGVLFTGKGRDLEEFSKAIRFDRVTGLWSIIGDAAAVQTSNKRQAVMDAFHEANGEPIGPTEVTAATGMKAANVRQLFATLKREGLIKAARYGKYIMVDPATTGSTEPAF
jgi:DNA polymerase